MSSKPTSEIQTYVIAQSPDGTESLLMTKSGWDERPRVRKTTDGEELQLKSEFDAKGWEAAKKAYDEWLIRNWYER